MSAPRAITRFLAPALLLALTLAPGAARAEFGQPDASLREALGTLRDAARDTVDHPADAARFGALGAAQLRVGRFADAERSFRRVLALRAGDADALAGLGRIALCSGRDAEAESLLTLAGPAEGAAGDRYRAMLRRHEWAAAAALAEDQNEAGRREMLERLAELPAVVAPAGPERAVLPFVRVWPVPIVRVKLNGQSVLMVLDPGATELLLDPAATHVCKVGVVLGQRTVGWSGTRVAARNALVQKLDLGGFVLTNVVGAVTPLHRYSIEVNPNGIDVAGVIGLPVLERLGVTVDFDKQQLELRRPGTPITATGVRVPWERWGENELMLRGTMSGSRRMAFWLGMGLPGAGMGSTPEVFDEVGVRAGKMANLVRGMGAVLQGSRWAQVNVPSITVGSVSGDHVLGWSGALDAGELWYWGVRRDGVLGPRFFVDRRVTFDWARHELLFEDTQ